MSPEDRQIEIHRSFQIRTVYTGKIYGGVQVVDTFMRQKAEDMVLSGYEGLYSELLMELERLAEDTPFEEMLTTDFEQREVA